jgi:effector-binding domain-containing protein
MVLIVEPCQKRPPISPGEYVCISFDWSTKHYYSYYQKLYHYIESNGIQTDGKVYQVSLPINYSSLGEEQFLTELRVLKK